MDAQQRPLRLLMPAQTSDQVDTPGRTPPVAPGPARQRRLHTRVACRSCRQRKGKCDGIRPACSACRKRASPCQYDLPDNDGRPHGYRKKNADGASKDGAVELIGYLKTAAEKDARAVLERIRRGDDVTTIVATLGLVDLGGLSSPGSSAAPSRTSPTTLGLPAEPPPPAQPPPMVAVVAAAVAVAAAANLATPALSPVPAPPRGSISSILDHDGEERHSQSAWHQRVMEPTPISSRAHGRDQGFHHAASNQDTLSQRLIAQGALAEVRNLVAEVPAPTQPPPVILPTLPP